MANDFPADVTGTKAQVFDALLGVAQNFNLSVDVLEKSSGFIQFKGSSLTPAQLDRYAAYPYMAKGANGPNPTFVQWNANSATYGGGEVRGNVSLTILLTQTPAGTHVKIHSAFAATNNRENLQLNSQGVLERDLENALRGALAGSSVK